MSPTLQRWAMRLEELPAAVSPYDLLRAEPAQPYAALLENAGLASELGRFSFFCSRPFLVFQSKAAACFAGPPGALHRLPGPPFEELSRLLSQHRLEPSAWSPGLPPLLGGAVGYLGYELLHQLEEVEAAARDDLALPDSCLMFCGQVVATDGIAGRSWVCSTSFDDTSSGAQRRVDALTSDALERVAGLVRLPSERPRAELAERRKALLERRPRLHERDLAAAGFRPNTTRASYLERVAAAQGHIAAGDVYEVCTTNRFDTTFSGSGVDLYRVLRAVSPSPFGGYLRCPGLEVLSSSPERFLRLDRNRRAETRPIKGTRPRGPTAAEDARQRQELEHSEKDRAENVMIVDLSRNDLGRVCEVGTVCVPELGKVESHPYTHQLTSTIRGQLHPRYSPLDLVAASFPPGSMTGAPKIKATQIISGLEACTRGIYSGGMGYFDFDGALDLSVVIRTFVKQGTHLSFGVGGAVVSDSNPADEYQEMLDKAHGLVAALEMAREGF